jgi:hypothetical protein
MLDEKTNAIARQAWIEWESNNEAQMLIGRAAYVQQAVRESGRPALSDAELTEVGDSVEKMGGVPEPDFIKVSNSATHRRDHGRTEHLSGVGNWGGRRSA